MILTYRYRLLPSKRQHRALEDILEAQRELYNAALQERIDAFRKAGVTRTYIDQTAALAEWRRDDKEAAAFPSRLQRATLKRLEDAFQAFYRRVRQGQNAGFPRFRGKGRFDSFGFREFCGISFQKGRIRFRGMPGSLRVHLHRSMPDTKVKACVFKRDAKGWYVGFAVDVAPAPLRECIRAVGVDLGITTFATLSDGTEIPSLRAARSAQRRLRIAQRALARKRRGSASRDKARAKVRRIHAAVARQRTNHLHQASAQLIRTYDVVVIEDLGVQRLARSALSREVHDSSWGRFISLLHYKAECAGVRVIAVDPWNTSQDCSECGARIRKKLRERQHVCSACGISINRDLNAARNILFRAGVGPGLLNVAGTASVQAETSAYR